MDNLQTPEEFDVFTCPLDGVTQIEASAGTGKTWNICALYVRLLLEKALSVEQILVVTFTKAATAELYERIRARLVLLVYVLSRDAPEQGQDDPFVAQLLKTTVGSVVSADEARLRLERALHSFDQAAIHTIHGFCQRALQEAPFAAALPFEFDWVGQEEGLCFELAAEFWRTQIEPTLVADADFAQWLAARGAGPAVLEAQLKRYLQKPLAHLVFDTLPDELSTQALTQQSNSTKLALAGLFATARTLWQAEHNALVQLMEGSLDSLKATSYKPTTLTLAVAAWQHYFEQGEAQAPLTEKAKLLTASCLSAQVKKGCAAPTHPFFDLADTLLANIAAVQAEHTAHWLTVLKQWLGWAPAALREKKHARRLMSFDDLLANLHVSLTDQPWLAQVLKRRYPAALIDEFQDTDPLQFEIFNRIFAPQGPLFLVGDPKQAIYSFRAADLHTYLSARTQAQACYTLATNQRSTAALIAACNRFFSRNPAAFVLPGLGYQTVRAGAAKQAPFIDAENSEAAGLHIWQLPQQGEQQEQILSKHEALQRVAHACAAEIVRLLALPARPSADINVAETPANAVRVGWDDAGIPTQPPSRLHPNEQRHRLEFVPHPSQHGLKEGLKEALKTGLKPREIAVIVQTHRQGSLIKQALARVGVGSVETAQTSVFSTPEAQDLECVLHALEMPSDARRLRGALTVDWFGVEAGTLSQFEGEQGDSQAAKKTLPVQDPAFWAERFTHYRWLWQTRGLAVMWRTLSHEVQLSQRIAAGPNGERRLADLAHLIELMQAQTALQPSIDATLRWLSAQRTNKQHDDEMQLRLESDRNLVQIVTVHKSKGLEYAVVFCPFLYDATPRKGTTSALSIAYEYHDANTAHAILHYGATAAEMEPAKQAAKYEQQAEKARLIYVALTRAVYRCYLVAGLYTSGASVSTKEARGSMLNWLIAGAGNEFSTWLNKPPPEEEINAAWQALADTTIQVEPLPIASSGRISENTPHLDMIPQARQAHRFLRESWHLASFTSLIANTSAARELANPFETLADHDALVLPLHVMQTANLRMASEKGLPSPWSTEGQSRQHTSTSSGHAVENPVTPEIWQDVFALENLPPNHQKDRDLGKGETSEASNIFAVSSLTPAEGQFETLPHRELDSGSLIQVELATDDILHFPRGAAAGECLHRLLELVDFVKPSTWPHAIERALREYPVPTSIPPDLQSAMMRRLLDDLAATELTPLASGLTLSAIDPTRRQAELEFTLPARGELSALRQLLTRYGYPDIALQSNVLRGYLKGFIDLVFEHQGRFWLIDWKSHYLGETAADYARSALDAVMVTHGYHLQALIYTLALHRYLKTRLPGYHYATHIGGYLYLFIRGIRPTWRTAKGAAGVYAEKPDLELIEALDQLLFSHRLE